MIIIKVAVLIQCHKSPKQINLLLDTMQHSSFTFFVHVDKKSSIGKELCKREDVILLPDDLRVDVQWGLYSQVEATLNLLKYAKKHGSFDYYMLISGQCFPVVSPENIVRWLTAKDGKNYMLLFKSLHNCAGHSTNYDKRNQIIYPKWIIQRGHVIRVVRRLWVALSGGYEHTFSVFLRKLPQDVKFFFGSQWWTIHKDFCEYVLRYVAENPWYEEFFQNSSCPDESFFQTLLMNSPFAATRADYIHYIDWSKGGSSPKNLTKEDFDNIVKSQKIFARKIDNDFELIDKLRAYAESGGI